MELDNGFFEVFFGLLMIFGAVRYLNVLVPKHLKLLSLAGLVLGLVLIGAGIWKDFNEF